MSFSTLQFAPPASRAPAEFAVLSLRISSSSSSPRSCTGRAMVFAPARRISSRNAACSSTVACPEVIPATLAPPCFRAISPSVAAACSQADSDRIPRAASPPAAGAAGWPRRSACWYGR